MSAPRLQLDSVTIRFGGLTAVSEVSLVVADRELAGLIGPNGAGKTTLFNLVTAVYRPTSGTIRLAGESTGRLEPLQLTAGASPAPSKISACLPASVSSIMSGSPPAYTVPTGFANRFGEAPPSGPPKRR